MTAAAKDLITIARAKQSNLQITDTTYDTQLQVWVTAVSDWIANYCNRDFYSRTYDECYNGNGDRRLLLRQYPIISINSVRYRPAVVLKIQNTATSTNQRATVAVTSTGLKLIRVASGVVTTDTSITWAGNATLTAVANAVIALGAGWTAQVVGDSNDYGKWPSADLYLSPSLGDGVQSRGALASRGTYAELRLHTSELQGWDCDYSRGWLLRAIPYTDPDLLMPEDLVWPVGINNFRVQYTAGFTTIPEAIQEAAAQWVSVLWSLAQRDPMQVNAITSTTGGGFTSQEIPPGVKTLLAPYKRRSVYSNQG
jgi:hypothetical protein